MDDRSHEHLAAASLPWKRVLVAEGILLFSLAAVLPLALYFGQQHAGAAGSAAAAVAFLVCWVPNAAALAIVGLTRDPQAGVSATLLGMLLRMGLPLALLVVLMETKHWLIAAGAMQMVLAFYLIALLVDTLLSVWVLGASRRSVVKAS